MVSAYSDQYDRVLVGKGVTITVAPTGEDGSALTLVAPATVVVTDGAGNVVGTTITATVASGGGSVSVDLPAASLAVLDAYTLTWSCLVGATPVSWQTTAEAVGGFYFSAAQFRAQGDEFSASTAAQIALYRLAVEQFIDDRCKMAYVGRGAWEIIRGDGSETITLGHTPVQDVYSLSVYDSMSGVTTDWNAGQIACLEEVAEGILRIPQWWASTAPAWPEQPSIWKFSEVVTIHYAHGLDRPSPRMSRAAAYLARSEAILDQRLPPGAVIQATEFGNFRMATAGPDTPTGIPWIDELLDREGHYIPSVG